MDDEEVGAFLVTPQNILDKMNEVKTEADKINTTVQTDPKIRPEFKSAWEGWYNNVWGKFYSDNTGFSGWFSRLTASTMDAAEKHETRVKEWRTALEKEIGRVLPGPKLDAGESKPFPWRTLAYVSLGIGAVVAVGYAASAVGGAAQAFKGGTSEE